MKTRSPQNIPVGISTDHVVGIADTSLLVPGASYTVWVTGRNSAGDSLPSNKITFTA